MVGSVQSWGQRESDWNTSMTPYQVCKVGQITHLWHAGLSQRNTLTLGMAILPFIWHGCRYLSKLTPTLTHCPWIIFLIFAHFQCVCVIWLLELVTFQVWKRQNSSAVYKLSKIQHLLTLPEPHSLTHSLNAFTVAVRVPGRVLGRGDTAMNKTPDLSNFTF